ncbi:MAG: hypothetical protein V3R93_02440 [Candidatus Hydrothermarchaeaceae archaeon]
MMRQRGIFDIISVIMMYFVLLTGIWGYSIGWYFNEIGVVPGEFPGNNKGVYDTMARLPPSPRAWDTVALLNVGQVFEYRILTRKEIDVSYNILKETERFFTVGSSARIKTSANVRTKSSLMNFDVKDILIKETFSIDRTTGLPTSPKYTTAFWNMEACHPTRYYFSMGTLEEGAIWEVPGAGVKVQVTDGGNVSGFYTYACKIIKGNQTPDIMWVSKEVPLLLGFDGENCLGQGRMVSRLIKYTPEHGREFNLGLIGGKVPATSWD